MLRKRLAVVLASFALAACKEPAPRLPRRYPLPKTLAEAQALQGGNDLQRPVQSPAAPQAQPQPAVQYIEPQRESAFTGMLPYFLMHHLVGQSHPPVQADEHHHHYAAPASSPPHRPWPTPRPQPRPLPAPAPRQSPSRFSVPARPTRPIYKPSYRPSSSSPSRSSGRR